MFQSSLGASLPHFHKLQKVALIQHVLSKIEVIFSSQLNSLQSILRSRGTKPPTHFQTKG